VAETLSARIKNAPAKIRMSNLTGRWNHNHPLKQPSKFEVFKDGELIQSGTYREGMCLIAASEKDDLNERVRTALEIIDESIACASTRNKLKGLLHGCIK
jgi:hypothetical protein